MHWKHVTCLLAIRKGSLFKGPLLTDLLSGFHKVFLLEEILALTFFTLPRDLFRITLLILKEFKPTD